MADEKKKEEKAKSLVLDKLREIVQTEQKYKSQDIKKMATLQAQNLTKPEEELFEILKKPYITISEEQDLSIEGITTHIQQREEDSDEAPSATIIYTWLMASPQVTDQYRRKPLRVSNDALLATIEYICIWLGTRDFDVRRKIVESFPMFNVLVCSVVREDQDILLASRKASIARFPDYKLLLNDIKKGLIYLSKHHNYKFCTEQLEKILRKVDKHANPVPYEKITILLRALLVQMREKPKSENEQLSIFNLMRTSELIDRNLADCFRNKNHNQEKRKGIDKLSKVRTYYLIETQIKMPEAAEDFSDQIPALIRCQGALWLCVEDNNKKIHTIKLPIDQQDISPLNFETKPNKAETVPEEWGQWIRLHSVQAVQSEAAETERAKQQWELDRQTLYSGIYVAVKKISDCSMTDLIKKEAKPYHKAKCSALAESKSQQQLSLLDFSSASLGSVSSSSMTHSPTRMKKSYSVPPGGRGPSTPPASSYLKKQLIHSQSEQDYGRGRTVSTPVRTPVQSPPPQRLVFVKKPLNKIPEVKKKVIVGQSQSLSSPVSESAPQSIDSSPLTSTPVSPFAESKPLPPPITRSTFFTSRYNVFRPGSSHVP
ncbi:MAG: hypothetical protein QM752_03510 [Gammaproteobacteria bacterium]